MDDSFHYEVDSFSIMTYPEVYISSLLPQVLVKLIISYELKMTSYLFCLFAFNTVGCLQMLVPVFSYVIITAVKQSFPYQPVFCFLFFTLC